MLYPFPPDGFFDFGRTYWRVVGITIGLVCVCHVLGALWYFIRRALGRRSSKWSFLISGSGVIISALLIRLLLANQDKAFGSLELLFWAAMCGIAVLFDSAWALSFPNQAIESRKMEVSHGLMIVAILGTTSALLLPSLSTPPEVRFRFDCKNNLKQIGLAMHDWHDEHHRFPDTRTQERDEPECSWRIGLLPSLEHRAEYKNYDRSRTWNDLPNSKLAQRQLDVFSCRSVPEAQRRNENGEFYTAYATLIGPNTVFPDGEGLALRQISDGTSNTILVSEACGQQILWTEPRDIEVSPKNIGVNLPGERKFHSSGTLSSYHSGGAFAVLADGAVRFVSNEIDPQVLRAITSATGGEEHNDF
ncbi:MAG: hypothetical protein JWM11_8068 [Planctomycetaceae bacterium]|nr:hypothetical protein [Planctomycetaceae bacterium]